MTSYEFTHFKKMVQVRKTKSRVVIKSWGRGFPRLLREWPLATFIGK